MAVPTMHDETIDKYFAGMARQHADGYNLSSRSGYLYVRRRMLVADALSSTCGRTLLDAGCGTGTMRATCESEGFEYHGIDRSSEMIEEARRRSGSPSSFTVGRVEALPYRLAMFDVVLALGVLEYVSSDRIDTALSELARVLAPGGTLIVSMLNRSSPVWRARASRDRMRRALASARGAPAPNRAPERTYTGDQVDDLFERSGLKPTRRENFCSAVVPAELYARQPRRWARRCNKLEPLSSTQLGRFALAHLSVAAKPRTG